MKPRVATLILRLPSSLHERLKREARSADMSLNKYCSALLAGRTGDIFKAEVPLDLKIASGGVPGTASLQDLSSEVIDTLGGDVEGLVLFGSYARGRQTAKSDIDLLIVLDRRAEFDRDVYSRWRPSKIGGHQVAPLFVRIPGQEKRIGGLWFEVALDGIVLFDRNFHVSRFLGHVRNLIAGGQVRRMVTHGHPYWVHSDMADVSQTGES